MNFIRRFFKLLDLAEFLRRTGATPNEVKDALFYYRTFKMSKVYNEEAAAFNMLLKTLRKDR